MMKLHALSKAKATFELQLMKTSRNIVVDLKKDVAFKKVCKWFLYPRHRTLAVQPWFPYSIHSENNKNDKEK